MSFGLSGCEKLLEVGKTALAVWGPLNTQAPWCGRCAMRPKGRGYFQVGVPHWPDTDQAADSTVAQGYGFRADAG
jgi:hypothetical protein